jgi:hypothetical protein
MKRAFALLLPIALVGFSSTHLPWQELAESDWLYSLATRFTLIDGHQAHYPTPTAELAKLLEARPETEALRALADARCALGDRPGALAAMNRWAEASGPQAWAETARWAAAHQELPAAFAAAGRALPGLAPALQRTLADDQIRWAEAHPGLADPIALRQQRAALFPQDARVLEDWLRALERAGRLAEVDQALASARSLDPERSLLLRSDLLADHLDHARAFQVLDGAVASPWSGAFRQAYASRADRAGAGIEGWRTTLEARFDPAALVRLCTYLQGKGRGDAVADLLRQMDRRHGPALTRPDWLLMARLYGEIDGAPEAFRATLAAAHLGSEAEGQGDLATLAGEALKAGGRPLPWGNGNDESYRWVAAMDRTPGFWTGAVSFLLTGQNWKEALDHLESESLPDRTFATARALAAELARRAPAHPALPALRVALMERHVERGEGAAAMALLPLVESGPAPVADNARRVALLAARQTLVSLDAEMRLMKARLRYRAADGSRPDLAPAEAPAGDDVEATGRAWQRPPSASPEPTYNALLEEYLARLEGRDRSHRASLDLILGELDRLPDAESLWLTLADRLENWNLDDELGPRYQQALTRFQGPGIWAHAARWYFRRNLQADLRRLADDVAGRFRGAAIFEKAGGAPEVAVEIPEQPIQAGKVRMVLWADWVRYQALKRFPHSPTVFREAAAHLVTSSRWQAESAGFRGEHAPVIVADNLMEQRRWAILFVEPAQREQYFAEAMRAGNLEKRLIAMETQAGRGPMEDLLLFEGWSRLSRFERAAPAGDRLALDYPGDGDLAQRLLSLHRSLNALEPGHAEAARALVARTAPALEDPGSLWTELGEIEEERGHPEAALPIWQNIVAREPGNPGKVEELATLLWDYNHDREALAVVEAGRKRLGRPRFFAFETGVLRENLHDLNGAVQEYLAAVQPEDSACFCSWFERDQRSLRRLAQLLGRERVYAVVAARIQGLRPGVAEDEKILAACLPLANIELPDPGQTWDADAWIDAMDQPVDPVGRAERQEQRDASRPNRTDAITRIGDLMLAKGREMARQATASEFLDALDSWSAPLQAARWSEDAKLTYQDLILARRAQLAPSAEEGIRAEVARAQFLAQHARVKQADAVWAGLDARISALPEGAVKLRAEGERAGYLERAKGVPAATQEWQRLSGRYPWSLGLLEDRLDFLNRTNQGESARALLESVLPKAGPGHRVAFLERLTKESLAASDLGRARRAVQLLLAEDLDDPRRLAGVELLARLSIRENPGWDPMVLAKAETGKFKPDQQADLYHALAEAADLEGAWGKALAPWIEALNRRTERDWLAAAGRSAGHAGKGAELLAFFEKQQQQSPRDVRWAVAVRDIRRDLHQVDGALAAAKAAVAVRPEREILWREAADLLVRADRIHEAADFLEGWNRPRPADEGVAGWRSELYARAGDGDRAMAVEQAALAAFAKNPGDRPEESAERLARAITRLLGYGLPVQALKLGTPRFDIRVLADSNLSGGVQCHLAMLNGQLLPLLERRSNDSGFLAEAARFVAEWARPEQREAVQAWVVARLATPGRVEPGSAALNTWWPFLTGSGLERGARQALAQRVLAARPGPWQQAPSVVLADQVGAAMVVHDNHGYAYREPDLGRMWVQDLTRRDQPAELATFLAPRWQELMASVRGPQDVRSTSHRLAWSTWVDQPAVLDTWLRGLCQRPDQVRDLAQVMGERRLWDRFWALAARKWDTTPLVVVLPREARTVWFRLFDPAASSDAQLQARAATVENVTVALERLLKGEPGAAQDPLIVKLRGPRTVGEVLGKDSQWLWPEFTLRRDPKGDVVDQGEARILGQGVDAGRLPGALWGAGPGEAWYVLEALARYRQGDPSAALLPMAVPRRGQETERTLLALQLAQSLGDLPLGLEMEAAFGGPAQDPGWLEGRLRLMRAAGHMPQAQAVFQTFVRTGQPRLTEERFRWLASLAQELGLNEPLGLLDPAEPVGPVFLAYLKDSKPAAAEGFHSLDPTATRVALANRWRGQEARLSKDQFRVWLRELWATDSAPLPREGLRRLGGLWPFAGDWLQNQPVPNRIEALDAVQEVQDPAVAQPRLLAMLAEGPATDLSRLLTVRALMARGANDRALAVVDEVLKDMRGTPTLAFSVPNPGPVPEPGEEGGTEEMDAAPETSAADPMVDRIQVWLVPFAGSRLAEPVQERFRTLLRERRDQGPVPSSAWSLALTLAPAGERDSLIRELDQAWFRGEIPADQLGPLARTLATVQPAQVSLWLSRWPRTLAADQARERGAILALVKDPAGATRILADTRSQAIWNLEDEIQSFDDWRRWAGPDSPGPAYWREAMALWASKPPSLKDRLQAHPQDVLAARSALRTLAPLDAETAFRVAQVLTRNRRRPESDREGDQALLQLKAARQVLGRSWRAAQATLGPWALDTELQLLIKRRYKSAEINQTLADLARLASKAGNGPVAQAALGLLTERKAADLPALRAALAADAQVRPETFRIQDGQAKPLRPRDLSWEMLAKVLKAEAKS